MTEKEGTIHLERYTGDAKQAVAGAQQIADDRQHTEVTPLHLLARLLERDRGVVEVFRRAGAELYRRAGRKGLADRVRPTSRSLSGEDAAGGEGGKGAAQVRARAAGLQAAEVVAHDMVSQVLQLCKR
jgi:ATP-dependent Clp protease ATP-binding subunit ClpA